MKLCSSQIPRPLTGQSKSQERNSGAACELKIVLMEHQTRVNKTGRLVRVMNEVYTGPEPSENAYAIALGEHVHTRSPFDKPNNAFFQYRADPVVKSRHHNKPGLLQESQIVRDIAEEWKSLSDREKLPYERKASMAAYEHKRKLQLVRHSGSVPKATKTGRWNAQKAPYMQGKTQSFENRSSINVSPTLQSHQGDSWKQPTFQLGHTAPEAFSTSTCCELDTTLDFFGWSAFARNPLYDDYPWLSMGADEVDSFMESFEYLLKTGDPSIAFDYSCVL